MKLQVNDSEYDVEISGTVAKVNGKAIALQMGKENDEILLDGVQFTLDFVQEGDPSLLIVKGEMYLVSRAHQTDTSTARELKAPMSGQLVQIAVSKGAEVHEGQVLLVLEAMKMENQIKSSISGRIAQVKVTKGQHVKLGDVLLVFE